jgi:hypothetical protein
MLDRGLQPTTILLAAVAIVAILVLLRRIFFLALLWIFRILLAPIRRAFRAPLRWMALALRLSPKPKAGQAVAGVSAGAIATVFAETREEINRNLPQKPKTETTNRLFCTWFKSSIRPGSEYNREKAEEDKKKARRFFSTEIKTGSNPLNLYDDIDGAFVVSLFKDSDAGCFHVLSEYKRAITANVLALAVISSVIVSSVAITSVLWPKGIDFYNFFGFADPGNVELPVIGLEVDERELFNKIALGLLSCITGYLVMLLYYYTTYQPFQINNMPEMNYFLVRYLSDINSSYKTIQNESTSAVVEITDHVKTDIVLWVTNLQWMAFRAFFIEYFLRNIYFQIRRNSIYALVIVPSIFVIALVGTAYLGDITELKIFVGRTISPQIGFYLVFAILLIGDYRYLKESFSYLEGSVEGKGQGEADAEDEWYGFHKLNLMNAMTKVMESYADQLVQWRSKFRDRGGLGEPQ